MTDNNRIAEIEAKIASAQAELQALKAGKAAPPPPPPRDEGVRIVQLVEPSNFVRPTSKELRELHAIVCGKYPQFTSRAPSTSRWAADEAREYFEGFTWAFERLGFIGRSIAPDHKHYVDFWSAECRDWLRLHRPAHVGNIGAGFLAAVVAHGDIPFIVGNLAQGIVWSVGITTFGGTKATDALRRVLEGSVLAPSRPALRMAPPSPARVYGG
jgi:hypothetical protein